MTRQRSLADRRMALKSASLATANRGAGREGSARARRAGESDLNTGLRLGGGVEVVKGAMEVPLGAGLEIDRDGKVASTGLRGVAIIKTAYGSNLTTPVGDPIVYVALPLSDPLSSYNPRGISIDTITHRIGLDTGGVYVVEAALTFYWAQGVGVTHPSGLMKVELTLAGSSAVDIYQAPSLNLEGFGPGGGVTSRAWPSASGVMTSVVNLLGSPVSGSVRVMVGATAHDGGLITVRHGNIKIERIG